ncbi:chemotaxis protein CheW [Acidisoma cellulosilytica]|uniref:Chemotaxis protein CheW n=1 Tax=Acidisoma cellulosilyticum TaxID=2802395 RepID=A0A963Z6F6_9PROT|nr:chemotaxis protein CheW [Acidisoma cellulosilyticum]MCB8883660.1 chemotaxis protein CheW [Acidisoma cellulosilyticum]
MTHQLVFDLGGDRFALPPDSVGEVLTLGRTTRVPHAPPALIGLGNVRGVVVPMVSMALLLGRPRGVERGVIVLSEGQPVGLVVETLPRLMEGEQAGVRTLDVAALLEKHFAKPANASRQRSASPRPRTDQQVAAVRRETKAILVLALARQSFGFLLAEVDEVIAFPKTIALAPGLDGAVVGSMVHRDGILPLLSLRGLLNLDGLAPAKPCVVILTIEGRRVGLVVDAVTDIAQAAAQSIDPLPVILTRNRAEAKIQAIFRRDDGSLVSLLSTDHVLSGTAMDRLRDETVIAASEGASGMAAEAVEQVLVFRLGDETFALPVSAVREVVALPGRLTRLPRAPAFVEGVMNLRGRAIPVIDQRRRFEVAGEAKGRRRVIITAVGALEAGFVVDAVSEVLRIPLAQLRPAPEMGEGARIFDRVASPKDDGQIMLVIEPQALLDRAERDLLAGMSSKGALSSP